jgi:hypothetical protein
LLFPRRECVVVLPSWLEAVFRGDPLPREWDGLGGSVEVGVVADQG